MSGSTDFPDAYLNGLDRRDDAFAHDIEKRIVPFDRSGWFAQIAELPNLSDGKLLIDMQSPPSMVRRLASMGRGATIVAVNHNKAILGLISRGLMQDDASVIDGETVERVSTTDDGILRFECLPQATTSALQIDSSRAERWVIQDDVRVGDVLTRRLGGRLADSGSSVMPTVSCRSFVDGRTSETEVVAGNLTRERLAVVTLQVRAYIYRLMSKVIKRGGTFLVADPLQYESDVSDNMQIVTVTGFVRSLMGTSSKYWSQAVMTRLGSIEMGTTEDPQEASQGAWRGIALQFTRNDIPVEPDESDEPY